VPWTDTQRYCALANGGDLALAKYPASFPKYLTVYVPSPFLMVSIADIVLSPCDWVQTQCQNFIIWQCRHVRQGVAATLHRNQILRAVGLPTSDALLLALPVALAGATDGRRPQLAQSIQCHRLHTQPLSGKKRPIRQGWR